MNGTQKRNKWKVFAMRAWLPILLVTIWWFASAESTSVYFPPLSTIVEVFIQDWFGPSFVNDLLPSLGKLLAGFAISAVLGITFGLILGMNRTLSVALEPVILFLRSVPGPVLVPFGILIIGIGASMHVFIMVLGAVWPVLLSTIDGVRSMDPVVKDLGKSYRLSRWQMLAHVILPNAGPQIFAGLRTALQLSLILIVVSEMIGSTNGIGYYVLYSQQTFSTPETWAGTFVLGIVGYVAALIFIRIEARVLAWQIGMQKATGKG